MKYTRSGHSITLFFALACLAVGCLLPLCAAGPGAAAVNQAAAVRSLEKCASLLGAGLWSDAEFEARLGASYDRTLADFPWVEALSLAAREAPRADILERVSFALAPDLAWRTYNRRDALLMYARIKAETGFYREALSAVSEATTGAGKAYSADADYIRLLSLYGLGSRDEARSLVSDALEKWPFDSRFPRTFLFRERSAMADGKAARIASVILSRLYLWKDDDRELLVLSVPFEPNPETRERNIRVYRNMGKADADSGKNAPLLPLSALYALEYGVIDEKGAAGEIFSASATGINLNILARLCRLVGSAEVRNWITDRLKTYDGIITDDANSDGIEDSRILYRLGRPVQAIFDPDQDGYPDCSVDCENGIGSPSRIVGRGGNPVVVYDTYPYARTVTDGPREYTAMPLFLSWAPVIWSRQDFGLDSLDFFTIAYTGTNASLGERVLINSSVYYRETASDGRGGETRVSLQGGVPVSAETREKGKVVSATTYRKGFPSLTKADRDGDGYFETTTEYGPAGRLQSVLVDRNGNRRVEYREDRDEDGTETMRWDSDEDSVFEISYTVHPDGSAVTEWKKDSGAPVIITVVGDSPRSVRSGALSLAVIRDPIEQIWWIGRIPPRSRDIVRKIKDTFNPSAGTVVSAEMDVGGMRIQAVRTGGLLFAEIADEK